MEKLAKSLRIENGTADWFEFHSLASVARQQIPKVLMDDSEVVDKLPILFRTLQGEPLPEEQLDELIDFIRSRH